MKKQYHYEKISNGKMCEKAWFHPTAKQGKLPLL